MKSLHGSVFTSMFLLISKVTGNLQIPTVRIDEQGEPFLAPCHMNASKSKAFTVAVRTIGPYPGASE